MKFGVYKTGSTITVTHQEYNHLFNKVPVALRGPIAVYTEGENVVIERALPGDPDTLKVSTNQSGGRDYHSISISKKTRDRLHLGKSIEHPAWEIPVKFDIRDGVNVLLIKTSNLSNHFPGLPSDYTAPSPVRHIEVPNDHLLQPLLVEKPVSVLSNKQEADLKDALEIINAVLIDTGAIAVIGSDGRVGAMVKEVKVVERHF